ncbi:hypothetical protein ABZT03_44520 [Streptomyces sp. NPDC005574]|uniref:hypothetical protein n=1 Tax=Streptomyces sp. NPDC005574 TaxID=3156891 RepID=UPI0033B70224
MFSAFDHFRQRDQFGKVKVIATLSALLSSFLPWLDISTSVPGLGKLGSYSFNAWNAGFSAWFPILMLLANGAYDYLQERVNALAVIDSHTLGMVVGFLATMLIALRWITYANGSSTVDSSAGVGLYCGLATALTITFFSYRAFVQQGSSPETARG